MAKIPNGNDTNLISHQIRWVYFCVCFSSSCICVWSVAPLLSSSRGPLIDRGWRGWPWLEFPWFHSASSPAVMTCGTSFIQNILGIPQSIHTSKCWPTWPKEIHAKRKNAWLAAFLQIKLRNNFFCYPVPITPRCTKEKLYGPTTHAQKSWYN